MELHEIIVFLLLGGVISFNYLRFRDVLYPPVLQAGLWMGTLFLYVSNRDALIPLSPLVFALIGGGAVLFSVGALLATRGHTFGRTALRQIDFTPKAWYVDLLFWLPLLGLLPFLLRAASLGLEGPYDSFFPNLRHNAIRQDQERGGAYGVWAYFIPLSFTSFAFQVLFTAYRTRRLRFAVTGLTALLYALFASGRTYAMLLMLLVSGILLITRRVRPGRVFIWSLLAALALFFALGFLVGKGTEEVGKLQVDTEALGTLFISYALAPLPALDRYLHSPVEWTWGANTFRLFFAVLARFGIDLDVQQLVQEYEYVPLPVNVYTVYQPYYTDFAFVGLLVAPVVLGFLHGVLYRKATQGSLPGILLYAFSLYPLVMQFYQDQYFSILSTWIQYGLLIFLYFYRLRFVEPPCV